MDCNGFSSQESSQTSQGSEFCLKSANRFVILWHAWPSKSSQIADFETNGRAKLDSGSRSSHFDLMFENGDHLVTFELHRLPIPGERLPMNRLANHRMAYLEYEGPISNDRGHVTRWTSGNYHCLRQTTEKIIVELTTPRLSARVVLFPKESRTASNFILPGKSDGLRDVVGRMVAGCDDSTDFADDKFADQNDESKNSDLEVLMQRTQDQITPLKGILWHETPTWELRAPRWAIK